jgi:hypothetical protein
MTLDIDAAPHPMRATLSVRPYEGAEPWPLTAAQLADLLPREIERYRKAAKEAGIPPQ